ncbi:MAG: ATP-binding protein [Vicinamibacterales bacterium]
MVRQIDSGELDAAPARAEASWGPEAGPVVTARWLARFRWAVALGAVATLVIARSILGVAFPEGGVLLLLAAQVASNAWLDVMLRRGSEPSVGTLGGLILFDIGILTALMVLTGGPSNPFTISYLVYITLAAVTLNAGWTWAAAGASIIGYGLLFVTPLRNLVDPHAGHAGMDPALSHQVGMGVAFAAAALLTGSFVTRIRLALEARERALAEARRMAAQQERLASLTTLAAGAAHELATPLSAIAVAAHELELAASGTGVPPEIAEDAGLIRSQVDRCREILDQMSGRADASVAHEAQTLPPARIVEAMLQTFGPRDRERVLPAIGAGIPSVQVPLEAAARSLRTLVKNAFDASPAGAPVEVSVDVQRNLVRFRVADRGSGMAAGTLQRAGEPFFTTKPVGSGFGLGLFLARTFAERWGGSLSLSSTPGEGTTATLLLPVATTEGPSA